MLWDLDRLTIRLVNGIAVSYILACVLVLCMSVDVMVHPSLRSNLVISSLVVVAMLILATLAITLGQSLKAKSQDFMALIVIMSWPLMVANIGMTIVMELFL